MSRFIVFFISGFLTVIAPLPLIAAQPSLSDKNTFSKKAVRSGSIQVIQPKSVKTTNQYFYTAQASGRFSKTGRVKANSLTWNCSINKCTIKGPWKTPGAGACKTLANMVGKIKSYGHATSKLNALQLNQCNAGIIKATLKTAAIQASRNKIKPAIKTPIKPAPIFKKQIQTKNSEPVKINKKAVTRNLATPKLPVATKPVLQIKKKPAPLIAKSNTRQATVVTPHRSSISIKNVNYISKNSSRRSAPSSQRSPTAINITNYNFIANKTRRASPPPSQTNRRAIKINNINYISRLKN
jgi:hypothetical protein